MIPQRGGATGRPRVSSRRTIEEAAAELFLEQGYDRTTVDDIARRAGVGRGTFFNYFPSKPDLLWVDVDEALDALRAELEAGHGDLERVLAALHAVGETLGPEAIPLAITQLDLIGARQEITASGLARVSQLTGLLCAALDRPGRDPLLIRTSGAALAGAAVAAWQAWASSGVRRAPLAEYLDRALGVVSDGVRRALD
jgi:AcrR family transcriptional regulator